MRFIEFHPFAFAGKQTIFQRVETQISGNGQGQCQFGRCHKGIRIGVSIGSFGKITIEGGDDGVLTGIVVGMAFPLTDARAAGIGHNRCTQLFEKRHHTVALGCNPSLDNNRYIWEGHSINTLFLRPTDGIIQDQNDLKKVQAMLDAEEARAAAENRKPRKVYSEGTPGLGDILYVDANNDGVVDFEDRKAYGRGQSAPITYGFDAGFNWKGIDFSILLQGVEGAKTLYTYEYETRVEAGYIINKEIAEGRCNGNKGLIAALAQLMNAVRHILLARAACAVNEYRHIGWRH
ncbi:hypothetical protein AXF24_12460 [Streptococcus pneumoniae]|nr:hypothetical protein AWW74_12475 [Streptococcus pneumoniae]KXB94715.1 hypothetical protein AXF24_12460 [Streptococcus pneumoniae]